VIESPQNPRVKALLRAIEEKQLFSLEGEKFIADAAQSGFAFEEIFHDSEVKPGRLAALSHHRPMLAARAVLERFCEAKSPQHVVAIARRRETPPADILRKTGPAVYLEGVQDPGNLGAVARVVESVGGAGLLASEGCADFFHPRALRGSAGSLLRLPVAGSVDFAMAAEAAHKLGREICGAVGKGGEPLLRVGLSPQSLFVFGSEGGGLSESILGKLDRRISIPMKAPVESLNVAVAAGIVLYRAVES
jgi:TrmH family RNA methyltransferase